MSEKLRRRIYLILIALAVWLWPATALLGEDEHLTDYAKGCRALRFFGWQKAAFWFREALADRPQSFGRPVPWSNANPQLYLPRYALGVSLFGLGSYEKALEQWRLAEEEWSGIGADKKRVLEQYLAVIREGRDIYQRFVCAEIMPPASDSAEGSEPASGGTGNAGLREEIRNLCYKGQFSAALKLARSLEHPAKSVSDPSMSGLRDDKVEIPENVPVAFAQEISDCEAPDRLKPWAHHSTRENSQRGRDDTEVTTQFSTVRRTVLGTTVSTTILAASEGRREVVTGAPAPAGINKVYSNKFALLISPDYRGTPWDNIEGAEEAIRSLENGLLRRGFRQENIELLRGYLKGKDLEKKIVEFVDARARHDGSNARNLIWVHFLGHAFRLDDDDYGVLITSDSPRPRNSSDKRSIHELANDKSVAAGIVTRFFDRAPHHLIFSFDSCPLGEPLFDNFQDMGNIDWSIAKNNPAVLLVARAGPRQAVLATPALTKALSEELTGCGHDDSGIETGYRFFTAISLSLLDRKINNAQLKKYGVIQHWRKGDMVLGVPASCGPAAKTPHPRQGTASLGRDSGPSSSVPGGLSTPLLEATPEEDLEQARHRYAIPFTDGDGKSSDFAPGRRATIAGRPVEAAAYPRMDAPFLSSPLPGKWSFSFEEVSQPAP